MSLEARTANHPDKAKKPLEDLFSNLQNVLTEVRNQVLDQNNQLELVNNIAQLITSTLDRAEVPRQLLKKLTPLFGVERASFWIVDHETDRVNLQYSLDRFGIEDEISSVIDSIPTEAFRIGGGSIVGTAAQSGKYSIDNNVQENPRYFRRVQEKSGFVIKRMLTYPVIRGGKTAGVVQLINRIDDQPFTDSDLNLLNVIIPWVTIALENSDLFVGLEQRLDELRTVQTISQAINSERDLEALLQRVAKEARNIVNADTATIYQYDSEFKRFFLQFRPDSERYPLPQDDGPSITIINQRQIIFAEDAINHSVLSQSSFTYKQNLISCIAAPLMVGEECVGILYINFLRQPRKFTENEKRIITIIADQAANAIHTVGRLNDTNRQLRTVIRSIEAANNSSTLDDLLNTYLAFSLKEINAEFGTIQLLDNNGENLIIRAVIGRPKQKHLVISADYGINGYSLREQRPIYRKDQKETSNHPSIFEGVQSQLAIPLMSKGRPQGVLSAESLRIDAFDIYQQRLFEQFASQASVLINERIKLENEQQKRIAAEFAAKVSVMSQAIVDNIKNHLGIGRLDTHTQQSIKQVVTETLEEAQLPTIIQNTQKTDMQLGSFHPLVAKESLNRHSEVIKILYLAANPLDTPRLRLDEEIRIIDQSLRHGEFRDKFHITQQGAVRISDLQNLLLRHKPHIVHFSGHGSSGNEIILEDNSGNSRPVSTQALSRLFTLLKDNIKCVILNACYSASQAEAIAEHIDCVIGMSKEIGDVSAISFAKSFYQALGFGRDLKTAFELGCLEVDLENLQEQEPLQLLNLKIDPEKVIFVAKSSVA